jgi:hypothetical protein
MNPFEFRYKAEHTVDTSQLVTLVTKGRECPIEWVLVIEKETVFTERLQELNLDKDRGGDLGGKGHGVILTVGIPSL